METKKFSSILSIVFAIIIVILVVYIFACCKKTDVKGSNELGNKALHVEDLVEVKEYDDSQALIMKVKNSTNQAFTNVTPQVIYYDSNDMPFNEAWGSVISYFGAGETRCIRFYDTVKEYSRREIGLFNDEDSTSSEVTDLRDKIKYETTVSENAGENGETKIDFNGENKHDKPVSATFEIAYYNQGKLIYLDQFITLIEGNSPFSEYEYLTEKYPDETPFPEGYTYEISLVEAVEFDDSEDIEVEDNDDIDVELLDVKDKIEHALFKKLDEVYGKKYEAAKIYVEKTYTVNDVKSHPELASLNLKEDDVAFEASINFQPAEGVNPMEFTIPNGTYNKESGWINDASRIGVLRKSASGEYEITDFGTGW